MIMMKVRYLLLLFVATVMSMCMTSDAFTSSTTTIASRQQRIVKKIKSSSFVGTFRTQQKRQQHTKTSLSLGFDPNDIITHHHIITNDLGSTIFAATTAANTQWIADAVATVGEGTPYETSGWWASYLNIFKYGLELVHNVIDQPLKNAGVESTWGPSIFLFTLAIRSLLLPFSIQQSKSAEYIKVLRPYVKEISDKYAKNEDAKNRAISKLYEDAKQNPLSGCLLSLAQLPIFLGLYRGVRLLAIDGELNESFLFIPSLEGPVSAPDYRGLDWLISGWTDGAPALGWEATLAFLVMPIILVVLQSITMQTLQPPVEENMSEEERETLGRTQAVLKLLPLMIGFFSLQVPAGLTIYWFSSNVFTLSQSLAVKAYFKANPPKIELPDYWDSALSGDAENMTPEERRKASQAGISFGPTFEELQDQAKFHVYVERYKAMKIETEGWKQRAQNVLATASVPSAMEEWVNKHNHLDMQQPPATLISSNHQQQHNESVASVESSVPAL